MTEKNKTKMTRRNFLGAAATTAAVGVAGCSGISDSNKQDTNTPTSENHPLTITDTKELNLKYMPVVTEENQDEKAALSGILKDKDGLEQINILLENEHSEKKQRIVENGELTGKQENFIVEFPATHIAPGTNTFTINATDTKGNTGTLTAQHTVNAKGYTVDVRNPDGENIGNYQTQRNWDKHTFNRKQLHQDFISKWHNEAVYNTVIQDLETEQPEEYNSHAAESPYSNSHFELGDEKPGHWDPDWYADRTKIEHVIGDPQNAIRTHQNHVHPGAYSRWNHRFAATLEEIVNNFNKEAKKHLEETGEKAFHTGWVNEREHGTVITYTDLENTEIEAEHPWQFVDTTSDDIRAITESNRENIITGGVFNPFVDGYESEAQTKLGYQTEKQKAIGSLQSFEVYDETPEDFEWAKLSINDNILDDIFNQHIPEEGSIDPILDMVEQTIDVQMETNQYVQVFGEGLDDYKIAVGDEELYNKSMSPDTTVTDEVVNDYLSQTAA